MAAVMAARRPGRSAAMMQSSAASGYLEGTRPAVTGLTSAFFASSAWAAISAVEFEKR
jgi:hypothetical protein